MVSQIEKWDYFEFELHAQEAGNPFLDVTFSAEFKHDHRVVNVAGFYDGDGVYKVRFMPDVEGEWIFVTSSNRDALAGHRGQFNCIAPNHDNHGPVTVIDHCHFAHADGTSYHPIGTTAYVWNLQGDDLEAQTLATLATTPFNKMRMCVFPKRYTFNNNEPPSYPFEGQPHAWDLTRFNPAYFRHLEQRILDLRQMGIEADLILFHPYDSNAWGFDKLPTDVNDRYLRYLVSRLASFRNVWWSFANEYDLMSGRTLSDWDGYFKLVQDCDPYDHLRSIHNCIGFYDHRKSWVTHCSIQHQNLLEVPAWLQQYGKPVIVDECGYEGDIHMIWGSLSAEEMVLRHWLGFVAGGYVGHGETYWNEQEELWWSKGGTLYGESAPRIAFLRQIIEAVPAPGLFPLTNTDRPLIPEGSWNKIAAGHNGTDYYLFYFGMHQPRFRNFALPSGDYAIDILDTWNMTVDRFADRVSGNVRVELPRKKYLAVRIQRVS